MLKMKMKKMRIITTDLVIINLKIVFNIIDKLYYNILRKTVFLLYCPKMNKSNYSNWFNSIFGLIFVIKKINIK
jgi:hypothetical protein